MESKTKICLDLLDIINRQEEMIAKQNNMIAELTNETMEKENMINELIKLEEYTV